MFRHEVLEDVRNRLLQNKETIAVAESVTSGFLQAAFSTVPDAAKFFQGGITVYNLGQKYRHLLVNPIHAESCNCVSQEVAEQMATQVCTLFSSHWGLAITGYATKTKEGDNQLFAWYAITHGGNVVKADVVHANTEEGQATQVHYVNEIVTSLQEVLRHSPAENQRPQASAATKAIQ